MKYFFYCFFSLILNSTVGFAQEFGWSDSASVKEYYDSRDSLANKTITEYYNGKEKIDTTFLFHSNNIFTYKYNFKNQLIERSFQHGCRVDTCVPFYWTEEFNYNGKGQLTEMYHYIAPLANSWFRKTWFYNVNGQIVKKEEDNCSSTETTRLTYSYSYNGKDTVTVISKPETIAGIPEYIPQFPGGNLALKNFILNNFQTSDPCKRDLIVHFKIDTEGKISDIQFAYGDVPCNAEIIRVLMMMPPWQPARMFGKPIDKVVYMNFNQNEITFLDFPNEE